MKFRVWPETLKQITISTIPVRLIHLHAVLKNTQLPCYCNLREGLEEYFILVEMGFPKVFCKRTKFKLNQREQRKT